MKKDKAKDNDYLEINRQAWNARTNVHEKSAFYDMQGFLAGKSSLKPIEVELLGDVSGKTILHLQCHFGQDSLSLARMGARVVGVDLSDASIARARELNQQLGLDADFICCDVYSLPEHLHGKFDIVFTSYGVIGWLPDLERWAGIVQQYLKPGGKFLIVEFHPVIWMLDEKFKSFAYSYFNTAAIHETSSGTYTDSDVAIQHQLVSWNHSLAETIQSLIQRGLRIEHFSEYDYSPHDCFDNTIEAEDGKFRIKGLEGIIPMVFAVRAVLV